MGPPPPIILPHHAVAKLRKDMTMYAILQLYKERQSKGKNDRARCAMIPKLFDLPGELRTKTGYEPHARNTNAFQRKSGSQKTVRKPVSQKVGSKTSIEK